MRKLVVATAALALLTACGEAGEEISTAEFPLLSGRTFGVYCQEDYQNNYQSVLPGTWTMCDRFMSDLDDTDTKSFNWNLHGAKPHFLEGSDTTPNAGLDSVDHLFFAGHGGAWTESMSLPYAPAISAFFGMWDDFQIAGTAAMRLGDDSRQLSIFSAYTCEIHAGGSQPLKFPGQIPGFLYIDRWTPTFRGGLRISTGTVEASIASSTYADVGKRYSNNLQAGQTIVSAWPNALNVASTNDPSVLMAGTNSANCWSRMDTMTLANHSSMPRLRDASVAWMCRRYWENI
jgi:hypothetical protein